MNTPLALNISNLTFSYPDTPTVLQQINLQLNAGGRVGLIGPNGAGKTTLFMTICGVLKPSAGQVELFGQPVVASKFHPEVGLVFQYPSDQLFSPSVRDDIAFGPLNLGLSSDEVDMRVMQVLSDTGLTKLADRPPHHLSGGQKRMVAIAGVQAMHPKLIIYDEPSANLDIRSRRRLINFMKDSQETVLVSSHDLELIIEVCGQVILLDGGTIITQGETKTIMSNSDLMVRHGLETPHSLR
ncbi:ABC transporter ATP-binding protein [Anaerolineales bacterium HSG6]|nr:ABC transporter ATP-binding protein [Anaerolineales bacterium HSG6]